MLENGVELLGKAVELGLFNVEPGEPRNMADIGS